MKTTQDNKLIAEFMGLKPTEFWGRYSISNDHCHCNEITPEKAIEGFASISKYSTSWDWLMPVVEKIESLGYGVTIGMGTYCIIQKDWGDLEEIHSMTDNNKLFCAYNAVVKFINWHNENK